MTMLLEICIVILTVAMLVMMAVSMRMLTLLGKATQDIVRLSRAVRDSAARLDLLTDEARALVASVDLCVQPVARDTNRFEAMGQRLADLSTTILEELETPVFTVAALTRGVRVGANHLLQGLIRRLSRLPSHNHGALHHE